MKVKSKKLDQYIEGIGRPAYLFDYDFNLFQENQDGYLLQVDQKLTGQYVKIRLKRNFWVDSIESNMNLELWMLSDILQDASEDELALVMIDFLLFYQECRSNEVLILPSDLNYTQDWLSFTMTLKKYLEHETSQIDIIFQTGGFDYEEFRALKLRTMNERFRTFWVSKGNPIIRNYLKYGLDSVYTCSSEEVLKSNPVEYFKDNVLCLSKGKKVW